MKVKYGRLLDFDRTSRFLLQQPELNGKPEQDALYEVVENITPIITEYNKKLRGLNISNANTDQNGSILKNEKGEYLFSKEGEASLIEGLEALLEEYSSDFTPVFVTPTENLIDKFTKKFLVDFIYEK